MRNKIKHKSELIYGLIVRAKNPENYNYQIEFDKRKNVFTFARIIGVKQFYEGGKNITYVSYIPFSHWKQGLVSMCKLNEFKREFKHLKFN